MGLYLLYSQWQKCTRNSHLSPKVLRLLEIPTHVSVVAVGHIHRGVYIYLHIGTYNHTSTYNCIHLKPQSSKITDSSGQSKTIACQGFEQLAVQADLRFLWRWLLWREVWESTEIRGQGQKTWGFENFTFWSSSLHHMVIYYRTSFIGINAGCLKQYFLLIFFLFHFYLCIWKAENQRQ